MLLCPICGSKSATEETRGNRRRRVCREGHSFHTVEVVEAYWKPVAKAEEARRVLREKGILQ
jgi:transcriptional regulator NrdR family protein